MLVENSLDELCLGVKGQSNSVIARSLRNIFRDSVVSTMVVVERWMDYRVTESNQTANADDAMYGSQTAGDKLRRREGNNPDRQLRSPNSR